MSLWLTLWNWGGNHPPPSNHNLDLLVNGRNDPVGIVKITDLKPGDDWYIDKDLFVNQDAKVYVHIKDLVATQGSQTEPEILEESGSAGPKSDLQNYLDYDLKAKNKIIIDAASHVSLPNVVSCWIPLGEIKKNHHLTITQSFHFDASVTNWAQGDVLTFTEEFLATTDSSPNTDSGRIWNPTLKKCIPKPTHTPKPTKTPKPTHTPEPDEDDDDDD